MQTVLSNLFHTDTVAIRLCNVSDMLQSRFAQNIVSVKWLCDVGMCNFSESTSTCEYNRFLQLFMQFVESCLGMISQAVIWAVSYGCFGHLCYTLTKQGAIETNGYDVFWDDLQQSSNSIDVGGITHNPNCQSEHCVQVISFIYRIFPKKHPEVFVEWLQIWWWLWGDRSFKKEMSCV